jgi:putative spermidine/putrescine transport system permease protein
MSRRAADERLGWDLRAANTAIGLFLLAPILVVIVASFSSQAFLAFPPQGLSLRWYRQLFASNEFRASAALSLRLGLLSAAAATVLGILAALGLTALRGRGAELLRALFVAPLTVPGIVTGIAMLFYFTRLRLGGTFVSLLLAHVALTLPYVIRIVSAGLLALDRSVEEAARSLGASPARTLLTVTLPLVKGNVLAAAIFAFIISFDELVVSLFLVSPRLTTLPVRIYNYIEYTTDPSIAGISTILVVLTTVAVVVIDRTVGFRHVV